MKNMKDWQKIITETIDLKFPNSKMTQLDRIDSIYKNVRDVENLINDRKEENHGNQTVGYRLAAILPDIFYLAGMRRSDIEKELEKVLKWFEQRILIFHGTEGYPEENWFPWLKEKIEKEVSAKGRTVFVPQFPSPPQVPAKISEWFDVLKNYENEISEETILIGHSLGGKFLLRVLEKLERPVKAAFFIGTPIGIPPIENNERDNAFTGNNFDWETIKKKATHFIVFQSDNDPYVGLDNGKELARNLGVELSFVPNAGHFNKKAGYTKFEELWEKLEPLLAK